MDDVVNSDQKITKNDTKSLNNVISKIESTMNILSELENYLEQYAKINRKPISSTINILQSYKQSIETELSKI